MDVPGESRWCGDVASHPMDKAGIEQFLSALDVYDIEAAYLELALRRGLPLASLDDSLRTAMQRAGGRLLPRST